MMKITLFVLSAILLTGCGVSRMNVNNWQPNDYQRSSVFYECLQQAQQVESRAGFYADKNAAAGGARTGAVTNKEILVACLNAKGYNLRSITKSVRFDRVT
jgi:predicted Fe-S protein YdhL (DUF1289 family)